MADKVGILFESTSFETFNKALADFKHKSEGVDTKLQKVADKIGQMDDAKVTRLGTSFQKLADALQKINEKLLKTKVDKLNNFTVALNGLTALPISPSVFTHLEETAKAIKKMSDAFDSVEIKDDLANIKKINSTINALVKIGKDSKQEDLVLQLEKLKTLKKIFNGVSSLVSIINDLNLTIDDKKIQAVNNVNKVIKLAVDISKGAGSNTQNAINFVDQINLAPFARFIANYVDFLEEIWKVKVSELSEGGKQVEKLLAGFANILNAFVRVKNLPKPAEMKEKINSLRDIMDAFIGTGDGAPSTSTKMTIWKMLNTKVGDLMSGNGVPSGSVVDRLTKFDPNVIEKFGKSLKSMADAFSKMSNLPDKEVVKKSIESLMSMMEVFVGQGTGNKIIQTLKRPITGGFKSIFNKGFFESFGAFNADDILKFATSIKSLVSAFETLAGLTIDKAAIQKGMASVSDIITIFTGAGLANRFVNVGRTIFRGKPGQTIEALNRLFSGKGLFDDFTRFDSGAVARFADSILKLINSMAELNKVKIDRAQITNALSTVAEIVNLFTGGTKATRIIDVIRTGFTRGASVGSWVESITRLATGGIAKQIEKVNPTSFGKFANSVRDLVLALKTLSTIEMDKDQIYRALDNMSTFLNFFMGGSKTSKIADFLTSIKTSSVRAVFLSFDRLFGGSVIGQLKKFKPEEIAKFGVFIKSISELFEAFSSLSGLEASKFKKENIGFINEGMKQIVEVFSGKTRGIKAFLGLAGGSLFKDISRFSKGGIENFSIFIKAIASFLSGLSNLTKASFSSIDTKGLDNKINDIINVFKKLAKNIDEDQLNKMTKIAEVLKQSANLAVKTEGKNLNIDMSKEFFESGVKGGKATIEGYKVGTETKSPSRAMIRVGKSLLDGLRIGVTAPLNFIIRPIKNLLTNISTNITGYFKNVINAIPNFIATKVVDTIRLGIGVIIKDFRATVLEYSAAAFLIYINRDKIGQAFNFVVDRVKGLFDFGFGKIGDFVSGTLRFAGNAIADFARFGLRAMDQLFDRSREFLRNAVNTSIEFESAFTGVVKTLDTSDIFQVGGQSAVDDYLEELRGQFLEMATAPDSLLSGLENAFVTVSRIGESAGALGVARENVINFTNVVGQLTLATDLSEESAANFLARLTTITGTENFEQIGSAIVALGNSTAATEKEIADVVERIAGVASSAQFSEPEILAIGAAIRSVGLNAELGGSSFNRLVAQINRGVSRGGSLLSGFSRVSGLTAEEFKEQWTTAPAEVFSAMISGLSELSSTELTQFTDSMGLSSAGMTQFLSLLSQSEGVLDSALQTASEAFVEFGVSAEDYNALQEETARRAATTRSELNRLKNVFAGLSDSVGRLILPSFNFVLRETSGAIGSITAKVLEMTPILEEMFSKLISPLATLYDSIKGLFEVTFMLINRTTGLQDRFNTFQTNLPEIFDNIANKIYSISDAINSFAGRSWFTSENRRDEERYNSLLEQRQALYDELMNLQPNEADAMLTYTVKAGDTLSAIAAQYEMSVDDLLALNPAITNANMILNGQVITIQRQTEDTSEEAQRIQDEIRRFDTAIRNMGNVNLIPRETVTNTSQLSILIFKLTINFRRLRNAVSSFGRGFRKIMSGDISDGLDEFKSGFNLATSSIKEMFVAVFQNTPKEVLLGAATFILTNFRNVIFNGLKAILGGLGNIVLNAIGDSNNAILRSFGELLINASNSLDPSIIGAAIQERLGEAFAGLGDRAGEVVGRAGNLLVKLVHILFDEPMTDEQIAQGVTDPLEANQVFANITSAIGNKLIEGASTALNIFDVFLTLFENVLSNDEIAKLGAIVGDNLWTIFTVAVGIVTNTKSPLGIVISLAPMIDDIFSNDIGGLGTTLEQSEIGRAIKDLFASIATFMTEIIPTVFASENPLSDENLDSIEGGVVSVTDALTEFFGSMFKTVLTNLPSFVVSATDIAWNTIFAPIAKKILEGIAEGFKTQIIDPIMAGDISTGLQNLIGGGVALFTIGNIITTGGILSGIGATISAIITGAIALINPVTIAIAIGALLAGMVLDENFRAKVVGAIQSGIDFIFGEGSFDNLVTWLEDSIGGVTNGVTNFFLGIVDRIRATWYGIIAEIQRGLTTLIGAIPQPLLEAAGLGGFSEDSERFTEQQAALSGYFNVQSLMRGGFGVTDKDVTEALTRLVESGVEGVDTSFVMENLANRLLNPTAFNVNAERVSKEGEILDLDGIIENLFSMGGDTNILLELLKDQRIDPEQAREVAQQLYDEGALTIPQMDLAVEAFRIVVDDMDAGEILAQNPEFAEVPREILNAALDSMEEQGATLGDEEVFRNNVLAIQFQQRLFDALTTTGEPGAGLILASEVIEEANQAGVSLKADFIQAVMDGMLKPTDITVGNGLLAGFVFDAFAFTPRERTQLSSKLLGDTEWLTNPFSEGTFSGVGREDEINAYQQIASQLISGLRISMLDETAGISSVATEASDEFLKTIEAGFGIQSPSTVFQDYGLNIIEGLQIGIDDNLYLYDESLASIMLSTTTFKDNLNIVLLEMQTSVVNVLTILIGVFDKYTLSVTNAMLKLSEFVGVMPPALLKAAETMVPGIQAIATQLSVLQSKLSGIVYTLGVAAGLLSQIGGTQVEMPPNVQPEGKEFGGMVTAGKLYEVLENRLPFELFRAQGRTYMLPNMNGEVISPRSSQYAVPPEANMSNYYNSSNSQSVIVNVPVQIDSINGSTGAAEINDISERISKSVMSRLEAASRNNTLTDRLNRKGRV